MKQKPLANSEKLLARSKKHLAGSEESSVATGNFQTVVEAADRITVPPVTQSLIGLLKNAKSNSVESDHKKHLENKHL